MKNIGCKSCCFVFLSFLFTINVLAGPDTALTRKVIPFNDNWQFHFAYDVRPNAEKIAVTLPHTWNAGEVLSGKINYRREAGVYEKAFTVDETCKNKRLFLYFEGVNSVADVFVNGHLVTEHKGGYTAFCAEITAWVKPGENQVTVQTSNAYRLDVLPLSGDFNVYGGIHRPVSLLVTSKDCISPLDDASPGVYLTPKNVSERSGQVDILTKLSIVEPGQYSIKTSIKNAEQKIVAENTIPVKANAADALQTIQIDRPHLWNGKAAPYLYSATVQLMRDGQVIDQVTQPLGLRYYRLDADKGFMLNGRYLDLHGVGFHEDVQGKGSALVTADYDQDMQLIKDIGATALRLTHYPHRQYFYDLCDRNGLVVWSEIPFVGPGGYSGTGYVNNPELKQQVKQVLTEMIRQNYNHPSVCFWGLFNELKLDGDDPVTFLKELNTLAIKEDPTRLTTCASFLDSDQFNNVSDAIAWNKYYGWYGGEFSDVGTWADETHRSYPQKPFAISEFGAGGSAFKHTETLEKPDTKSKFHPEEWQALYHEKNWEQLKKRPFIWGKFVWALTDFGSSIRNEGDTSGINDKGLVTYDRAVKKDAYYFYKANWNPEPMIYITDRRNITRHQSITSVKVYANVPTAELWLNDKLIGALHKDDLGIMLWQNITLQKGINKIVVKAKLKDKELEDWCEWELL